jgi:hypothetical protein
MINAMSYYIQDAIKMRRHFFINLLAREANAWRKYLPTIVKYYVAHHMKKNMIDGRDDVGKLSLSYCYCYIE